MGSAASLATGTTNTTTPVVSSAGDGGNSGIMSSTRPGTSDSSIKTSTSPQPSNGAGIGISTTADSVGSKYIGSATTGNAKAPAHSTSSAKAPLTSHVVVPGIVLVMLGF